MPMKRELIAYGTPYIDNLVHIDHLPTKKDEGALILQTSWQGGGKVSSALTAFGQLGGLSSMMGVAGADNYGEFLIRDYERYGVDTSHIARDGINHFSLVLSDKVTHGRNIIGRPGTTRKYTLEDIDEAFVRQHKVLHLENADEVSHRLAAIIHEVGGTVCFDGDGYSEATQQMLPEIDVFIGSEFYYTKLFGESTEYEKNLREVMKKGPRIVVFTLGDKGSVVTWGEDGYCFAPGYKVEVVDTLGAGDVYHGGFIFAMMQGRRPDQCAQFANAVSAIKCTGIGGRAATPTLAMVEEFMATGKCDRTLIEEKTRLYANFGL